LLSLREQCFVSEQKLVSALLVKKAASADGG
jgi:hypothetical protein